MKDYTITEALTLVRDAALEGRKLEAWCDAIPRVSYRYDKRRGEYVRFSQQRRVGFACLFSLAELFGTWHVREVEES